ncbi:MAG: hypothetical protein MAG715_00866 [Methanonatronarchaeales archaeon]|nr:hypothetical protein [Methanonatronarchaeales archaeon]
MPAGEIPPMGLGTWQNTGPRCADSVETALEAGYRHIDTAQLYDNEAQVGIGMERSEVPREEVTLATKVWVDRLTRNGVLESTAESLKNLRTDYVDILYVHWPGGTYSPEETLSAFDELVDDGRVRHVGVSNFTPALIEEARRHSQHPIYTNQVEMHPLLPQDEMRRYCVENDIHLVAYSPLARGRALELQEVREVAERRGATPAQVCLAWLLSRQNVFPVPKGTSRKHIEENIGALDLELTEEDLGDIDEIEERKRLISPPSLAPW